MVRSVLAALGVVWVKGVSVGWIVVLGDWFWLVSWDVVVAVLMGSCELGMTMIWKIGRVVLVCESFKRIWRGIRIVGWAGKIPTPTEAQVAS